LVNKYKIHLELILGKIISVILMIFISKDLDMDSIDWKEEASTLSDSETD